MMFEVKEQLLLSAADKNHEELESWDKRQSDGDKQL